MSPVAAAKAGFAYAILLRRELSQRNQDYARAHGLPHCPSYGEVPTVVYEPYDGGLQHGNFMPGSYKAILQNAGWAKRLSKRHPQARAALPRNERGYWCELDSSNSSDALLMNIFCGPGVFAGGKLYSLLGEEAGVVPEFGVRARVPLEGGRFDRTEVDMRLGTLLVEAKLTETDFQTRTKAVVHRYRDFQEVFERKSLPQTAEEYLSYQLIRNVLAAHATGCSFCVMTDARRPDLIEAWYSVMRCVRLSDLRTRCKVLTWQEVAEALPPRSRNFLAEKYGIESA